MIDLTLQAMVSGADLSEYVHRNTKNGAHRAHKVHVVVSRQQMHDHSDLHPAHRVDEFYTRATWSVYWYGTKPDGTRNQRATTATYQLTKHAVLMLGLPDYFNDYVES